IGSPLCLARRASKVRCVPRWRVGLRSGFKSGAGVSPACCRAGETPAPPGFETASKGLALHRERRATAAGALGTGVVDAEAASVQFVMIVDGGARQVHQAALVDDDRHAVELERLIELVVERRVEVQLVLEPATAAADDAQPQIDLLGEARVRLAVLGDDALD